MDLSSIKKEEVFQVPEGYFDELEESVMDKVRRHRRLVRIRRIATISAAAVITLVLGVNLWLFMPDRSDEAVDVAVAVTPATTNSEPELLAANITTTNEQTPAETSSPNTKKAEVQEKTAVKHSSTSNNETLAEIDFSEADLDNADYQILDYYNEELVQLDYWF